MSTLVPRNLTFFFEYEQAYRLIDAVLLGKCPHLILSPLLTVGRKTTNYMFNGAELSILVLVYAFGVMYD